MFGKHHTEETRRRLSATKRGIPLGEKQWNWKGDSVGYGALHDWVKRYLPKPDLCQNCKQRKKLELANLSGHYKRDLKDWKWLCVSCHRKHDKTYLNIPRDEGGRFTSYAFT